MPVSPNDTWRGGSKIGTKSVTYYLNGPLLFVIFTLITTACHGLSCSAEKSKSLVFSEQTSKWSCFCE
jgi:hypothetical protein